MKKYKFKIVIFIGVVSLLYVAYYNTPRFDQSTVDINGHVFKIEAVYSSTDIMRGLSGRETMADDQAMLFIFPDKQLRTFWMKDMNFNIDLLWIENNEIVAFENNMLAPVENIPLNELLRYTSPQPVDKVLEIKAGLINSLNIKIGDTIQLESKKL